MPNPRTAFSWRAFGVLGCLGGLAVVLFFPFPPPVGLLIAGLFLIGVLVAAGLYFGRPYGLGAPLIEGWPVEESWTALGWSRLAWAIPVGAALSGIVVAWIALGWPAGVGALRTRFLAEAAQPVWIRWVISGESGILEELIFRLFLVSLVVWFLRRSWLPSRRWPLAAVVWIAIVVATLAFGAAHLPRWLQLGGGPAVIAAVLAVNGIAGLGLGWVYWRWGIEAAILSHITGDVVAHVLAPELL